MEKYFSMFALVGLLSGMECRSIILSSLNEAIPRATENPPRGSEREFSSVPSVSKVVDNSTKNFTKLENEIAEIDDILDADEIQSFVASQGFNLEKILSDFAERTVDIKNYEERATQWLRLLKRMLESMSSGSKNYEKSRLTNGRFNDVNEMETIFIDDGDDKKIPITEYNWLGDLLEFLDEQDIDGQSSDDNESHVKSRYDNSSTLLSSIDENSVSDQQGPEQLDSMLVGVRNEIDPIRKYFEKLCSKHHSMTSSTWHVEDHNDDQSFDNVGAKKL